MTETITDFIEFPPRDEILSKLREVEDSSEELDELYTVIADRLAARTYERSASAFILIELVYDFEENHGGEWSYVLPRAIMSLTEDRDLALTALSAFNEIKDAIGPSEASAAEVSSEAESPEAVEPPEAAEEGAAEAAVESDSETKRREMSAAEAETKELFSEDAATEREEAPGEPATEPPPEAVAPSESDLLMAQLQTAQKALTDMGLGTRVSIDLAMRRSTRDRVSRTLQDISALRTALRRFEELLSRAEIQVLESAGLLWGDDEE